MALFQYLDSISYISFQILSQHCTNLLWRRQFDDALTGSMGEKKSIQDEDKVREMLFINFVFHFVWKFSIQVLSILKSIIKNIQFIEKCILFSNMHKFSNMLNLWNQSWFSCMDCCIVWPEEKWPPDWAWFLPRFFSPFCHQWSFGSLPLSPLACLVGDT